MPHNSDSFYSYLAPRYVSCIYRVTVWCSSRLKKVVRLPSPFTNTSYLLPIVTVALVGVMLEEGAVGVYQCYRPSILLYWRLSHMYPSLPPRRQMPPIKTHPYISSTSMRRRVKPSSSMYTTNTYPLPLQPQRHRLCRI